MQVTILLVSAVGTPVLHVMLLSLWLLSSVHYLEKRRLFRNWFSFAEMESLRLTHTLFYDTRICTHLPYEMVKLIKGFTKFLLGKNFRQFSSPNSRYLQITKISRSVYAIF